VHSIPTRACNLFFQLHEAPVLVIVEAV
jgi:hypothetical protein